MTPIPATIARFFTPEGRLNAMPSKQATRHLVLAWIAGQALPTGVTLDEPSLNLRLRQFHEDTAMVRRYMVEAGLVVREPSGRAYRLADTES